MDNIEIMKKIFLLLIAAFAVCAISLTSCKNKPPYMRLEAAVDSLNAQYQSSHPEGDDLISYEKWENVVHFHFKFPGIIDRDAFEPIANNIKELFVENLVSDDEFGICTEILNAHSNVVIDIEGLNDTTYEVLITNDEIAQARESYLDVKNQEQLIDQAEADREQAEIENVTPAEIEHELLEGNAPSVAAGYEAEQRK